MDAVKNQLMKLKTDIPDCTATRQRLRSILSDYFPTEKQLINAILNAYDEDVENRLKASSDRTLVALQLIKVLKNDYGMTDASAFLAIESWCYILGYSEVAEALSVVAQASSTGSQSLTPPVTDQPIRLESGIYLAGYDIPSGDIKITVSRADLQSKQVYYGILRKGSNSNQVITNGNITTQAVLNVNPGQRLEIRYGEVELTPIPEVK